MPNTNKTKTDKPIEAKQEAKESIQTNQAVNAENEALKKQLEDLKAQMELMAKMVQTNSTPVEPVHKKERYITFVNMTKGNFIMKGSGHTYYTLEGQFGTRRLLEREAKVVVSNMPNSIQEGLIYIPDSEFVRDCELEGVYEHILSDEQLKSILSHDASYVLEVYKNACDGQKKIIIDMVEAKRLNGESVDANILVQLGELCKRNLLDIKPMEDMKE